jgi:V/A-type H+/Na+-transporting ATPase subunit I
MSIATMSQLTVIGRKKIAQDLLSSLQSLGVVQIDPLEPSSEQLKKFALNPADKAQKEGWDAAVSKSAGLIEALGVQEVVASSRADVPNNAADVNAQLATIASQVDKLVAERADYRDELDVIKTYLPTFRDLTPSSGQLDTSRYLQTLSFLAPAESLPAIEKNFRELLQDRVDIAARPRGKDMMITAVALKKDKELLRTAVSRSGFSELALPDRYKDLGVAKAVHTMEERSLTLPKRLTSIDDELAKLAGQHGGKLQAIHQVAFNNQARYDRMTDLAESKYGFALQGWVPSVDNSRVMDSLKKQFGDEVVVESREADEHHDDAVPVKLENPGWVKPFEGLLSLFAPPKYGNFEPTWVLAIFFPFFFGLVVGDIGFALLFAAIGWWMRRRGAQGKALNLGILGITIQPGALRPISTVIFWCSIWAAIFGFVFGEFFGNFLEKWPTERPIFYYPGHFEEGHGAEGTVAAASEEGTATADHSATDTEGTTTDAEHSTEGATVAQADAEHGGEAAAGHSAEGGTVHKKGIIPILLLRVEKFNPILIASLMFGILQVLGGWLIRVIYGFKHHDMKHVWEGIGMLGGLIGLIVFAWGFVSESINGGVMTVLWIGLAVFVIGLIMSRVFLMIIELASNAGAILSYLRLFAVGLSSALVANLATDLGFAIGGTLPVIGPILGIVIGLAVHLIAIALTIIGHTLQPLRLNYVEFFTKFGFYDESGRPYSPFRLLGGK